MGEAILIQRGRSSGEVKVEFNNFSPGDDAITIFMPVGTKYKFGATEETAASVEITVQTPVTGYVKFKSGVIS
jgi:hypothetical protein